MRVRILARPKTKKKPKAAKIDSRQLLVQAAIDFLIGFLLLIVDKLIE